MRRLLITLLLLGLASPAMAAIGAKAVWEVRGATGSNTNGGFYISDAGTTDYSQQAAAQLTVNDAVTNTSTTITSATGGFTDAMVGNGLYLSGDGEWYEIKTRVDGNEITVDRATNDTGGGKTVNVGGALGGNSNGTGIQTAMDEVVAGNTVYIKGNCTLTADLNPTTSGTNATNPITYIGYGSTRTDETKPVLTAAAGEHGISTIATWQVFRNFKVIGVAGKYAISSNGHNTWDNIIADGGGGTGVIFSQNESAHNIEVYNSGSNGLVLNSTGGFIGNAEVHDNGGIGIAINNTGNTVVNSLIYNNTGIQIDSAGHFVRIIGCTIDCETDGVQDAIEATGAQNTFINNIIANADTGGKYGIDCGGERGHFLENNKFFNCDTNTDITTYQDGGGNEILTGSPFTGTPDYSLNDTSGAGDDCRNVSYAFPSANTTSYTDMGAAGVEAVAASPNASFNNVNLNNVNIE